MSGDDARKAVQKALRSRDYPALVKALDVECGLHSGIPQCCIDYFVTQWWPLVLQSNAESAAAIHARTARKRETEKRLGVDFRHMPCDACLDAGRVVTVLPCPPDCRSGRRSP